MNPFHNWGWHTRRKRQIEKVNKKKFSELSSSKKEVNWNIYGWKQLGQAFRGEAIVHGLFKYRFWIPLVMFGKYMLRKVLVKDKKDLSKEWYDEEMRMFDDLFEKSIHDWAFTYLYCSRGYTNHKKNLMTKEQVWAAMKNKQSCQILRTMKSLVLTMAKYDTAYREFIAVLLHNISIGFNKRYNGEKVRHLMYDTSTTYDVDYYYLGRMLKERGVIKDVKYTYSINGHNKVQPIADEIIIDNYLTNIKPKKIHVPKFNRREYDRWINGKESKKGKPYKKAKK